MPLHSTAARNPWAEEAPWAPGRWDEDPLDAKWKQVPSCAPVTLDQSVGPQNCPNPGLMGSGNTAQEKLPSLLGGRRHVDVINSAGDCMSQDRLWAGGDPGQMDTTRRKQ